MRCKFCDSLIDENTTVCANCGNSLYNYDTIRCLNCGYPANYKKVKKLKLKLIDWAIIVLFFPLSILYFLIIRELRTETFKKCTHCNHIEND